MKYSKQYINTRDIDWFAKIGTSNNKVIPIHVASRGTSLPDSVNDKKQNRMIQSWTAEHLEETPKNSRFDDVWYNDSLIKDFKMDLTDDYFRTFGEIAHLGFYSFDTLFDGRLVLVAKPCQNMANPLDEIIDALPLIDYSDIKITKENLKMIENELP